MQFRTLRSRSLSAIIWCLLLAGVCIVPTGVFADEMVAPSGQPTLPLQEGVASAITPSETPAALHYQPVTIDLTVPADDLWERIRHGFSMPSLNDELVLQHQMWFQNHPEYLRRVVERSRRYLFYIVEELERRGMPMELALLPMVESSFNPMAYSRAHASGLWQFIPATGKRYDLQQNWWHDQRRDIVASTNAALDYLQDVYEMHGDWHLALASYNWGEGAVKRAVLKNQSKNLPGDYASLTMPNETRHYVPKLMALKAIFSNPAQVAELNLPRVENRPYFATYEPTRPMDIKLAAKFAEMSVDEFLALNPAHNRPVINPATPLVIPADRLGRFQENLAQYTAPLSSWRFYTLKSGDKLNSLAPRFGITLADLKRVNGLQGRIKVRAGASLLVPANGADEMATVPESLQVPEVVPERATVKRKAKGGKWGKQTAMKSTIKSKSAMRKASNSTSKPHGKATKKPAH